MISNLAGRIRTIEWTATVILSAFCLAATALQGQQPFDYGTSWRALNVNERFFYVSGYQEGSLELGLMEAKISGRIRVFGDDQRDLAAIRLSPPQRRHLGALLRRSFENVSVERFGARVVAQTMTDLYADPANSLIPFSSILEVALMRLRGSSDADVSAELQVKRGAASSAKREP